MANTVAVAARRNDSFCLVRQYRYTVGKDSWEFPSGHVHADETPLNAAKRELQEEAGLEASRWTDLGTVHPALGILSTTRYLFLAEDLREVRTGHDASEQGMLVRWFPLTEINRMIRENDIFDDYVLAVLYKLNTLESPN
jgi:8-oxo-dGTP pyrophosphatase MutT (NUDIX family)